MLQGVLSPVCQVREYPHLPPVPPAIRRARRRSGNVPLIPVKRRQLPARVLSPGRARLDSQRRPVLPAGRVYIQSDPQWSTAPSAPVSGPVRQERSKSPVSIGTPAAAATPGIRSDIAGTAPDRSRAFEKGRTAGNQAKRAKGKNAGQGVTPPGKRSWPQFRAARIETAVRRKTARPQRP